MSQIVCRSTTMPPLYPGEGGYEIVYYPAVYTDEFQAQRRVVLRWVLIAAGLAYKSNELLKIERRRAEVLYYTDLDGPKR